MNTPAGEIFIARDRAARIAKCSEAAMQRAFDAIGIEPAIEINFQGFYTWDQVEHAGVLVKSQQRLHPRPAPVAKGAIQ